MTASRSSILREMGLAPLWRLRARVAEEVKEETVPLQSAGSEGELAQSRAKNTDVVPVAVAPHIVAPHIDAVRALGRPLPAVADAASVACDGTPASMGTHQQIAQMGWDELEACIRDCKACGLCEKRKQAVPGVGDREADWMLVGEGPGAEEDRRGEPFVGPAGKLLDAMLQAIGLQRDENVYIANSVKCRPPFNRTPESDEIHACLPYLHRQIELVRPRILIALGRPAAQSLLNTEIKINAARGKLFHYQNIPVVVTYHPAYLLRNQADKRKAWEDLCFARRVMAREEGAG